ncbi:MAG: hypothetical protein JWN84_2340, partial [Nocardioides sp.]|nr:hypothetical protein [Nocardioides sp.]
AARDYGLQVSHARTVQQEFCSAMEVAAEHADAEARRWLAATDGAAFVGSRHHVVPRFLLERWADSKGQVQIYRRIEGRHGRENITNLAIRDFYTFIDKSGRKDSSMESLLGVIESATKPIIDVLVNPLFGPSAIGAEDVAQLAQFASFQATRTPRRRREIELQTEWYVKTMAQGRTSEAELREWTIAPHQNELIEHVGRSAENILPFFACRPLTLLRLDGPHFLMSDEPVMVMGSAVGPAHHADCSLTDAQFRARQEKWLRKTKKGRRGRHPPPGRVVHFSSTAPSGFGTADEILLVISPGCALIWGPLEDRSSRTPIAQVMLRGTNADRVAGVINDAIASQALDWVISRVADTAFADRQFEPPGPLMRVCDGTSAATSTLNESPLRFRPHRLTDPPPDFVPQT